MLGDIVESGSRTKEIALHIFRLGEQKPRVVQKGVIFVAFKPFFLLFGAFAGLAGWLFLYGVQGDGFLHLFDGSVVRTGGFFGFFVCISLGRMHKKSLGIVVLVVFGEFNLLVVVRLAVVVHIIASVEGLPKTRASRVFLGAARAQDQHGNYSPEG